MDRQPAARLGLFGGLRSYLQLIRPKHWVKNAFVLAPLFFARLYGDPAALVRSLWAAAAFCAVASFVYVINDLHDREKDRHHPVKCRRPLASGAVTPRKAVVLAVLLLAAALGLSFLGSPGGEGRLLTAVVLGYAGLNLLYSAGLKNHVLLDVFIIAAGFLLRILAGSLASGALLSPWILSTTFFLALFLGFGKRYNELFVTDENLRGSHRKVLDHYTPTLLRGYLMISASLTIVFYTLYTISSGTGHSQVLLATVPFVVYGLMKYYYLVVNQEEGGDPADLIFRDGSLLGAVILWVLIFGAVLLTGGVT